MTIEMLGVAVGIIATIITTTVVVVSKLTALEVAIARLQVTIAQYEHRISALEKWRDV